MMEDKQQSSMLTMFGVIFTVIALVALIALVLVRSKAQYGNNAAVNQQTSTQAVAPVIGGQRVTQGANAANVAFFGADSELPIVGVPAKGINLSAGSLQTSDPPTYSAEISDDNSIAQALQQPNAVVSVTVISDEYMQAHNIGAPFDGCTDMSGQTPVAISGEDCVNYTFAGNGTDQYRSNAPVVEALNPNNPSETAGTVTVATPLPSYFHKGPAWYVLSVTPVDANGDAQPSLTVTNVNETKYVVAYVYGMPAISVSPTGISYFVNTNEALSPGVESDAYAVTVSNLGNVPQKVSLYAQGTAAQAWATAPASGTPLYMNADIEHFLGRASDATADLTSWSQATAQVLDGGIANMKEIMTPAGTAGSWRVPRTTGPKSGSTTWATRVYDTKIKPSAGSIGTYYSNLINIAEDGTS